MVILLLVGAVVIVASAILLVLWYLADRRMRPQITTGEVKALTDQLESAAEERRDLTRRIEQLESIASDRSLHGGL